MPPVGVGIKVANAQSYRQLAKDLRQAGRTDLRKALRRKISEAGKPVLADVKAAVREIPVTSRGGGTGARRRHNVERATTARAKASASRRRAGLRATIASATKLQITVKGVRFVVQSSKLPADQQSLPRHLDSEKGWRHPVFGDRDNWVHEQGRPYFAVTIKKRAPVFRKAILEGMEEIKKQIEG
jgi:hypothetical protein